MTKYLLFSGPKNPDLDYKIINKYLTQINAKTLLYISFHRVSGENYFKTLQHNITTEVTLTKFHKTWDYEKGSILKYDAIYIPGGHQEALTQYANNTDFGSDLREWANQKGKRLYIGSSAGVMVLGKILYNSYIKDDELFKGDTILDGGIGIFPDTVFDVHFDTQNRHTRMKELLEKYPEITLGIGLDDDSTIAIYGNDIDKRELIRGNIHIYHS